CPGCEAAMDKLQQWQKVREIVGSALERPLAERSSVLDEVCSSDPELRAEVESLMSAYRGADGLSEGPWRDAAAEPETQPKIVSAYRVLKVLVIGGMGRCGYPDSGDAVYTPAVIEEHEGIRDEALALLRQAIEHGLPPEEGLDMETDPDLMS